MVTIVIAYQKDSDYRERNLFFLKKNLKKSEIPFIIAEQKHSEGEEVSELKQEDSQLILYSKKPFQKSKLYNFAARHVYTEYIWFLDVDVFLDFELIINNIRGQDVIRPFFKIFHLPESETTALVEGSNLKFEDYASDDYWGKYSILLKKSIFLETGGFDERIRGWGWEDIDFAQNKLRSYKPYVISASKGFHLYHPTSKKDFERKNYYYFKENFSYRKSLSFCTAIKNRIHQIKDTLPRNLEANIGYSSMLEFVVLDCSSTDGLSDWIVSNFFNHITSGYLKLFKISDFKYWNASLAKNTAHNLGEGEVLVNLDCDNFTGVNGGKALIDIYNSNPSIKCCHQWCRKEWFSGNYGRISFRREIFEDLGGYDESFQGMGYQDTDLLNRFNIKYPNSIYNLDSSIYNQAIYNDKDLSIENLTEEEKAKGFFIINSENELLSKQNIESNKLLANNGLYGKRSDIEYYDVSKNSFHPLCA